MKKLSTFLIAALVMAGCSTRQPAPVADRPIKDVSRGAATPAASAPATPRNDAPATPKEKVHVVQRGETLIAIALQYGLDYKELASWNNIENVNLIHAGQELRLAAVMPPAPFTPGGAVSTPMTASAPPVARPIDSPPAATVPAASTPAMEPGIKSDPRAIKVPYSDKAFTELEAEAKAQNAPATAGGTTAAAPIAVPASPAVPGTEDKSDKPERLDWSWPARGKVLAPYTEASKGIDIAGTAGAAVLAAADGKVMYSGTGIRGYGKLVILKHNNTFLSAYAHNSNILVKEGQDVKRGQKIAEMGSTDTDQVKLHFEIRKQGKPVDPAKILPAQ